MKPRDFGVLQLTKKAAKAAFSLIIMI